MMVVKDRLGELLANAQNGIYCETVEIIPDDHPHQRDIQATLAEAEAVRMWISSLDELTNTVRVLISDHTYHNNTELQQRTDSVITEAQALALKISGALRQLQERAKNGNGARSCNEARARIARLHAATSAQRYDAALQRHHALLASLRGDRHALLKRQIQLTNLEISEEECEALLDSDNIAIFVDNVTAQTAEARRALRDVEERRHELARVEQSLKEVRDLFLQLAHIVAQQQEQLDSVEYFALQATEHVESGGQELLKGSVSKKKTRKKKMSLIICVGTGLLVVLLVLIYT